jgi:hypothetical protein
MTRAASGVEEMTRTLQATFDGQVLRPDEALELEPDTRVQITIRTLNKGTSTGSSFLKTARKLKLDGPSDWSSRLEDYLYGAPANDE